jgi:hypothetical protein
MPAYMIRNYALRYILDQDRPRITVQYKTGNQSKILDLYPPKENTVYIADMLRNEKPVFYVENPGGLNWLTTSFEEIGEEES